MPYDNTFHNYIIGQISAASGFRTLSYRIWWRVEEILLAQSKQVKTS